MSLFHLLQNKKAVIFDLDGTLVDSMWMWKAIDIQYLGQHGIALPEDLQDQIEGMSFTETAAYFKKRFDLPESVEEIKTAWNEMTYEKYANEVPLKPGAEKFLSYLRKRNVQMAIATSNSRELVTTVIRALHIESCFSCVITSCEVGAGKPAPDIYRRAAGLLGVKPSECLVFEDLPAGILAGKRAGMTVIAVEDTFSLPMAERKKELADGYIHTYEEMLEAQKCIEQQK